MAPEQSLTSARTAQPELRRALGRWSMVALAINCTLGSGIFGLPSVVAALLGRASPWAVLLAGAAMAVIIACYAEVASQFDETGGTYLYLRHTFGRLVGLQVGWMSLLTRLTAGAAAVNLLVAYLSEFWPAATEPVPRLTVIGLFIGTLAAVNYRGVGSGALVSNVTVIAKLAALGVLCLVGVGWLALHRPAATMPVPAGVEGWLKAWLLLLFAYGGYEAALNPMGEARNPRRDVAFALFAAILVLTALYSLLQLIVVGALPDAGHSSRPLADVARVLMGPIGAAFIAIGALVSVYGYVSANLLTVPRNLFALAERGDFPAVFAAVHPRFRTPYVSIVVFAILLWAFAQLASFSWNVTLSAIARILYYAGICVAVPVLRRRQPQAAAWRLPGGMLLPALGVLICLVLLTRVDFSASAILIATVGIALLNWIAVKGRGTKTRVAE
jgi:basic amino acid/polyamine antiporter, APA family